MPGTVVFLTGMFLIGITSGQTTQGLGCPEPCPACKDITEEKYNGTWQLKAEVTSRCPQSCLYSQKESDGKEKEMCFCDPGPIKYQSCNDDPHCYVSNITQCDPGYEYCFHGFCCRDGCRPTLEETFSSLSVSELKCQKSDGVCNCSPHFECCHDEYCCPSICPETKEDAVKSFQAESIMSCSTCDGFCDGGVSMVKDMVCDIIPEYLFPIKLACKTLLGAFSPVACKAFCTILCHI